LNAASSKRGGIDDGAFRLFCNGWPPSKRPYWRFCVRYTEKLLDIGEFGVSETLNGEKACLDSELVSSWLLEEYATPGSIKEMK
jgi:hypothetical protein